MRGVHVHLLWPWLVLAALMPVAISLGASGWGGDPTILWQVRLPRVLTAITGGATLAVAGGLVQAILRNPLAEPGIIGLAPAAAVAGALATLASAHQISTTLAGVVGALLGLALLMWWAGHTPPAVRLILLGVGLNAVGVSTVALIAMMGGRRDLAFWTLGSTAVAQLADALALLAVLLLAVLIAAPLRRDIEILSLGPRAATVLGVPVRRTMAVGLGLAAILTGVAVSTMGVVALLGLAAPWLARSLVGHDLRRVLWTSAGLGGVILLSADLVARTVAAPVELPLASIVAIVALPTFLVAAQRVTTWN